MATFRLRLTLRCLLAAMPLAATAGCNSAPAPAPTTNDSQDPSGQALPRPEEALAYLKSALSDETRIVEVFNNQGQYGALDKSGRDKMRRAVATWWNGVEAASLAPKPGERPFRVTPDMGIRIYPPGSASALQVKDAMPMGQPDLRIMIYKARQISRVLITDPTAAKFNQTVYIIPSPEPMEWVNRLFAGKL